MSHSARSTRGSSFTGATAVVAVGAGLATRVAARAAGVGAAAA
jgi:hypothetical protein